MKKYLFRATWLLVGIALAGNATAVTVSIESATGDVLPGTTVTLNLVISGLGDMVAPSLGAFDIDLGFDPSIMTVSSYTLGDQLGSIDALEAVDVSFGLTAPGAFNVAEVSILGAAVLDGLQGPDFTLASIDFLVGAIGAGESTVIGFGAQALLSDGAGDPIAIDVLNSVTLTGAPVPVPGAIVLLAPVLVGLGSLRRKHGHAPDSDPG